MKVKDSKDYAIGLPDTVAAVVKYQPVRSSSGVQRLVGEVEDRLVNPSQPHPVPPRPKQPYVAYSNDTPRRSDFALSTKLHPLSSAHASGSPPPNLGGGEVVWPCDQS